MLALVDVCHATAAARGRLCACLAPQALGHLRAVAADTCLADGEILFRPGQRADAYFGVRQGVTMLTRTLSGGRRQVLSFLFPGEIFGFAVQGVHECNAVALGHVSLCRIPVTALTEDPLLAARLHRVARSCLLDGLDQVMRLGRMSATERVADFLFQLWLRLDRPDELHLPMHLSDVADHLGLRSETVCRKLAILRRKGLIGSLGTDGVLPLLQPEGLRQA